MIYLENAAVSYGGQTVLEGLTLHVPPGARVALMGPSGCGKSSVLNLIAGLISPAAGAVTVNASAIGYAFQEPRLLPWLTAVQNVNAVLSDGKATMAQAEAWLALVGLEDAAQKRPGELSGGMCQRVNLARALAANSDILLLDEPLKGLDEALRRDMLALIQKHSEGRTLILATHSQSEAGALTDRVLRYEDKTFV